MSTWLYGQLLWLCPLVLHNEHFLGLFRIGLSFSLCIRLVIDLPNMSSVTSLIFNSALILWYFTRWHFTQHPYWSEPSVSSSFQDLKNQLYLLQDHWLTPQINTRLFIVLCPHLHDFRRIFEKVTHPITT